MVKRSYKFPAATSDKPMSHSLSSSSFVSRGHECLPNPNPDSKSTPQLEQNVEPKSTKLGLNDIGEFSSSFAGAITKVMKMSQSCSLKSFGEGEGVSSTLRLENGKKVRRPPAKGHDCLPKRNPDSKSTPQLEQNVEPKSTKLGLNDDGEFSSSVAGTTTEVIKTSQSCSLKVFGEGEGVSSTLRLENGKKVRRPPTKYQSFLSVDIISDDHEQKPRRPLKAHLKPIVVPSTARSNDGGVPPPADAHELSQLPSNSVPIGSPKP
ncbi:hypothetical protein TanjilG_03597 [Lupinus angustifolius]|uniref:Uncharacterized protein n=1 Tax=Lupinus angustifolius TaxID=3871 RepID=A0A1J7GJ71_LUPAN|nr:hypothetical protein TanjilG_03597 [Lupinus angustifolius]